MNYTVEEYDAFKASSYTQYNLVSLDWNEKSNRAVVGWDNQKDKGHDPA